MGEELESTCASFLAHWKGLRDGGLMPTAEAFLDHPSTIHAPWLFLVEIAPDTLFVRLEGTGLVSRWGRDLTGDRLFHHKSPDFVSKVAENFRAVVNQPCGYYALNQYQSVRGRSVRARVLYLPLQMRPDRNPRVVGYSVELQRRAFDDETLVDKRTIVAAEWIDVGAGVPAAQPHRPSG
jgi:hypothetical protein